MKILEKLNDLSFVIGAFFTIISLVLFGNIFFAGNNDSLSIYTASSFLIFGVLMMFAGKKTK